MSVPSDDVPRWQPPNEPSEDVPRWEPPAGSRETAPGWEREPDVPRWEPEREVPRWQPPAGEAPGPRWEPGEAPVRRMPPPRVSPFAAPFLWWGRHPWVIVWTCVFLAPGAMLLLRAVDEAGLERVVLPLEVLFIALFVLVLLRGALASARRSLTRLVLGTGSALVALLFLLWPVLWVTLGRVSCPPRAGADLGVPASAAALDAWLRGDAADAAWQGGEAAAGWRDKARAITLQNYQLVETGCWERVAPIDASRTWHDFRVTIKEGERAPLSKVVVVHTASAGDGWKITGIEGPLP
jgi:hypothetical protein